MSLWPEGYQSAAVITVNFDGESFEQPALPDQPLWGRYSFGRYGAQIGVERLLELLERYGVRATFFLPGWDVARYPAVMERIAARHDVAGRGYAHEDFSLLSLDDQRAVLERSEAVFERAFGSRPRGWRAPDGLMTLATRGLLAERGYRYDSSFCDDDVPYVAATAGGARIVELPQFETATDRHYYQVHRSPAVIGSAWREELSAVHEAGGLFNLALSPRGDWGSGRGVRLRAVSDLLQALHETPNIWRTSCGELADWLLQASPASEDRVV